VLTTKKTLLGALAGGISLSLVLAACGSDGNDETDAEGDDVATGTPVTFGIMTQTAGSAAQEVSGFGREAGEWYVNNQMGGIGGHPLELSVCDDDLSPENAVSCANSWVSEDVPVVIDTYSAGIAGAVPALLEAGIPYVGTVAGDTTVEKNENPAAYYFTGPLTITAAGIIPMMQSLEVDQAAFVVMDAPSAHTYVDAVLLPMAERGGIDVEVTWVDPATTDFSTVAATVINTEPDLVGNLALSEDGCTGLIASLRTQGWDKPIYGGSCSHFADDLPPEQAAGVSIVPRTWLPQAEPHAPAEVQEQIEGYNEAMAAVGHEGVTSSRAVYTFTSIVTLAQILNEAGVTDFTSANIAKAVGEVKDFPSFMGPVITCDGAQFPGSPSACADQGIFFTVQEDGSYMPGDPDGFVQLDLDTLLGL
jgi:branched-chain amino acid transport system substrate-binding protein